MTPVHPAIVLFLLVFVVLAGCTGGSAPLSCGHCVGPYDLTLTSHRAALGLPH